MGSSDRGEDLRDDMKKLKCPCTPSAFRQEGAGEHGIGHREDEAQAMPTPIIVHCQHPIVDKPVDKSPMPPAVIRA
jgi:hypothetical protein